MQEIRIWSLGWEDPVVKEMATSSSILDWKIPLTEEYEFAKSQKQLSDSTHKINLEPVEAQKPKMPFYGFVYKLF